MLPPPLAGESVRSAPEELALLLVGSGYGWSAAEEEPSEA